ncbi:hypothetical protein V8E53_008747 [Lactarius tabidus]
MIIDKANAGSFFRLLPISSSFISPIPAHNDRHCVVLLPVPSYSCPGCFFIRVRVVSASLVSALQTCRVSTCSEAHAQAFLSSHCSSCVNNSPLFHPVDIIPLLCSLSSLVNCMINPIDSHRPSSVYSSTHIRKLGRKAAARMLLRSRCPSIRALRFLPSRQHTPSQPSLQTSSDSADGLGAITRSATEGNSVLADSVPHVGV